MRGLELSRRFYREAVQPILARRFPRLEHGAALLGWSSEVLGFDDEVSRDHQWGPRVQLFVADRRVGPSVTSCLAEELPPVFEGFPTNFGPTEEPGTARMAPVRGGPVDHRVETFVLRDLVVSRLGVDPRDGFTAVDWLVTPAQRLLELTAGEVFADPAGELTRVRELLAWYPHDVWLLVMGGLWRRVAQLEHLAGRAALRGDDLGSRVIAASIARDLMRVALVQERRYPPYPKWLGSAYAALGRPEAGAVAEAMAAGSWYERERGLVDAYEAVAARQNELGVAEEVDPSVRRFFGRPFRVLFADRFVEALRAAIADPDVARIDHLGGSIDAICDNTDVLTRPSLWRRLVPLYDRTESDPGSGDGM